MDQSLIRLTFFTLPMKIFFLNDLYNTDYSNALGKVLKKLFSSCKPWKTCLLKLWIQK